MSLSDGRAVMEKAFQPSYDTLAATMGSRSPAYIILNNILRNSAVDESCWRYVE